MIRIERPPVAGDALHWKQTGEIVWNVKSIDGERAVLTGELFGKPSTKRVRLNEVEVRPEIIEPEDALPARRPASLPAVGGEEDALREGVAPERPRRGLEAILDDVVFSAKCLDAYRQRFARTVRGPAINDRLREEIRRRGYIVASRKPRPDEYARIRVDRRFDVILFERPSPDHPVRVDGLWFPRKRDSRRKHPPLAR